MSRIFGKEIEELAEDYLQQQGLKLVTSNYCCKFSEIDLIMQDQDVLVFVEVRYRKNPDYGDGVATVTKRKQSKIARVAAYYLQQQNLYDKVLCRFDVIAVSGGSEYEFNWIRDAFYQKW